MFVGKNLPVDTQTFVSISEHVRDENKENVKPVERVRVEEVKDTYFPKNTKLFYVGEGRVERGFLSQSLDKHKVLHMDTIDITVI